MEIKNTRDLKESPKINLLLYGAPGSGKTTIAGTFPKPLYLNVEAGVNTLRNAEVDYVNIETLEDLREAIAFAKENKYGTIIFDSVTEFMKKLKYIIMGDREALSIRDWGILIEKIEKILRTLRDIDMHVVFIMAEEEKDDDGSIKVRPSLSGKDLPVTAMGFVDIVGYTYVEKSGDEFKFKCQFLPDEKRYAKNRFDLPAVSENISFERLMKYIKGTKEALNPIDDVKKKVGELHKELDAK